MNTKSLLIFYSKIKLVLVSYSLIELNKGSVCGGNLCGHKIYCFNVYFQVSSNKKRVLRLWQIKHVYVQRKLEIPQKGKENNIFWSVKVCMFFAIFCQVVVLPRLIRWHINKSWWSNYRGGHCNVCWCLINKNSQITAAHI